MDVKRSKGIEVFSGAMPSQLEARDQLIDQILQSIAERGFQPDRHFHRLCLDEAISNAIIHGNQGDESKTVVVRVFTYETEWSVEVADEGPGFDWQEWIARLEEEEVNADESGRGIALLLKCCHEVHFAEGGRTIRMIWKHDQPSSSTESR